MLGTLGTGLLAACSNNSSTTGADTTTRSGVPTFLYPAFPVGFGSESVTIAGTEQRITFVLRDDIDIMRAAAPASATIAISLAGTPIGSQVSARHDDGIITPYYPVEFVPPQAGQYEASLPDFPEVDPVMFVVRDKAEVAVPFVGDPMRSVDTPTFENHRGVEPVCTRAVPCPFHELNLADVLNNGRPTVMVIATPGFCQTDICGPVVDLLIDAAPARPDVDFIHAEVYIDPSVFETGKFPATTPAVDVNELPFEPVLYVADADATIVSTLSTTWDQTELATALAAV